MPAIAFINRRRSTVLLTVLALAAGLLLATPGEPAGASPVNATPATYNLCNRVFPDPHAYWPSPTAPPDHSPFAKGVGSPTCRAADFIQYQEMIDGNTFLEDLFPQFVEFYNLEEDFGDGTDCTSPAATNNDYCSAGITPSGVGPFSGRQRSDLYLLRITDERVPDDNKKFFAFPLSIHGIERAGVEGGTRAGEDLPTWAWCEALANGESPTPAQGVAAGAVPNCAQEAPIPHPVLETQPGTSLTAGHVLKNSVIYLVYANADGWRRGDTDHVPRGYQRFNGNSVDMNRDWPTVGFTYRPYTPWSEPETKGFGEVLSEIRDNQAGGQFEGGIDLHGQLNAVAFSFTLLGASQRDFGKNQRILQTTKGAWEDAEQRLGWHPLITPNNEDRPTEAHMYGVQWGTVWDTINYTVTGGFGDWIDSPLGLGADGIDNEMSFSHIGNCGTGTCFITDFEQLHIDGNKSLIYAMLNYSLLPEDQTFQAPGDIAYVHDPRRFSDPGSPTAPNPYAGLPQQASISGQMNLANQFKFEFQVEGPASDPAVYNGGLEATANPVSISGFDASTTPGTTSVVLEQNLPHGEEEPGTVPEQDNGCGADDDQWVERNRFWNQNQLYFASGQAVHTNFPAPGLWRVCLSGDLVTQAASSGGVIDVDVNFSPEKAWEDPGQLPYDVSNMDFFTELAPYVAPGRLVKVEVDDVLNGAVNLDTFNSVVIADNPFPGYAEPVPPGSPQPAEEFDNPGLTTAPCAGDATSDPPCSEDFEFDVQGAAQGYNNQKLVVRLEPAAGSVDWDLYVQRQDPVSGNYSTVGQSTTGSAAEEVTLLAPPEGHYRARVVNWSGGQPPEKLVIEFSDQGAPPLPGGRTDAEKNSWGQLLKAYAERGGNLVLTDGALRNLAYMGLFPRDQVSYFSAYAGNIGFTADAGGTDTYTDPLAANVNQPGAAEGAGHRHQTYEPVPIGYPIQNEAGADYNGSPIWAVDQTAWEAAGGRTAGTTGPQEVTLGELPVGQGRVRVIGALIPFPTEESYHPFGLASYSVTYTGYQVFNNALQWNRVPAAGGTGAPVIPKDCSRLKKLTGYNIVIGTQGKDTMVGTSGKDGLCGRKGKDKIRGLGDNDVLIGGKHADKIVGAAGNDGLFAGAGNDRLSGGAGKDRLVGHKGNDRLAGGGGRDVHRSGKGKDACRGGPGNDKYQGCEKQA